MNKFFKITFVFILFLIVLLLFSPILATRTYYVDLGSFKIKENWSINSFVIFSSTKTSLLSDIVSECNFGFPSNWVCVIVSSGLIDGKGYKVFTKLERGWLRPNIKEFKESLLKKVEYELEVKNKKLNAVLFKVYCPDIRKFIEIINQRDIKESEVRAFIKSFNEIKA